ncbi:DMT family transporter [Myxococcota bacterium]|nr:DMT family transporter [Myxococcota bacterium]
MFQPEARSSILRGARDLGVEGIRWLGLRWEVTTLSRALLVFVIGVVGISFAGIFVRLAVPAPPVTVGFYRLAIATGLLSVWALVRRKPLVLKGRGPLLALAAGICFGTDLALWNTSLMHTSVATSTLLVNTTPLYVGLYTGVVLRETLDHRFTIGALVAILGCALLLGLPGRENETPTGALLALAAAIFYAAYLLIAKAARSGTDTFTALFLANTGATAALGLYALAGGDDFSGFPIHSWMSIMALAIVSQVCGVMGILWALRYLPATVASVALLGQPLGAAVWGWGLLGESIAPSQALGGLAVLFGILLASRSADPSTSDSPTG